MSDLSNGASQQPSPAAVESGISGTAAIQPSSSSGSKYAKYYAMNPETSEQGLGDPKPKESGTDTGKAGDVSKPAAPAGKDEGKPKAFKHDWERSISRLTRQKKEMQDQHDNETAALRKELSELKEKIFPKDKKPPLDRKNFATDEAFKREQSKQDASDAAESQFAKFKEQQEADLKQKQAVQSFRENWTKRVHSNFGSKEEVAEFDSLVKGTRDNLSKEIHEFVQNSDVGPRMMRVCLQHPEFVKALNGMPQSVRIGRLAQLESAVASDMQQEYAARTAQGTASAPAAKTAATKAPAPIGAIGTSGSASNPDDDDSPDAVARYKRKKFGK